MFSKHLQKEKKTRTYLPTSGASKLLLVAGLSMLGFALGCGSSGPNIPINGNFSNSSLKGSYVYNLYGIDTSGFQYTEAGVFVADGNGNITSGVDDFVQPGNLTQPALGNTLSGRYSIGNDGNGSILFTLGGQSGNTFQVAVTMVSTSQLYITEADTFANASGEANLQTGAVAAPSGTYVFRIHSVGTGTLPNASASLVGAMTSTSGSLSGSVDELRNLALNANASIMSGGVSAPDSTGRGTLTFTDSLGITSHYEYYAISSSIYEFLQIDANFLGQGRMELQSGPPNFSGNYVFGSKGDTANLLGARTVGMLTSGSSGITGGYDSVQDGSPTTQQPFGGSFAMTPDGRLDLTLTPNGRSPISEVVWMVNSGRAFYLINSNIKVEDGTMDQQTGTSFSNTSLKGQYAFVNEGFFFVQVSPFLTRVGTFIPDGNGNVNLNEVTNNFDLSLGASVGNVIVPGTYSVAGSGRATATLTSSSNSIDLVMYMASPSAAYVLQTDAGTSESGKMAIQVSP